MRRTAVGMMAAAAVLFAAGLSAQGKTSFAGKWTREAPAGGAAAGGGAAGGGAARGGGGGGGGRAGGFAGGGGGGFNCGMGCDIAQTAAVLTVTRPGQNGGADVKNEFKLDGSDSSNPGGREGAPPVVSKAKWAGETIVISTTRDMQGTSVTSTQTLSIEGGKLVVETNSGREGATPTKATYTKG